MPRILVIADDLTGAAEIAGIATRFGLSTTLLRTAVAPPVSGDVVVYDTDTRLLSRDQAVSMTAGAANAARATAFDVIFKKTDSALRGQPHAEIDTVATAFKRAEAIWVPQNPSRGRTITGGRYYVHGTPLNETEFARDPLQPATSAEVDVLLRETRDHRFRCVPPSATNVSGLVLGEASTPADVARWADALQPGRQTAAGGADFFEAILKRLRPAKPSAAAPAVRRPLLYVRGTASAGSAATRDAVAVRGNVVPMPAAVFDAGPGAKTDLARWVALAVERLDRAGEAMLTIDNPADGRPGRAKILQFALATAAERILETTDVRTIACEGGATAAAVCERLDWRQFAVEAELSPGVVLLRSTAAAPRLAVKPGSYAWPTL